ncbi:hypothetical protein [Streptococcus sp. Marseille-Q5986]|uniref:hypothetical protein n=1 Tax=Streptococcus sp. Marseille-Q5986 TaxID=2972782 RepID=UPI002264E312|nr:hypothetical protein [Streptococcus sp. Marseille-Q5986]
MSEYQELEFLEGVFTDLRIKVEALLVLVKDGLCGDELNMHSIKYLEGQVVAYNKCISIVKDSLSSHNKTHNKEV